MFGLQMRGDDDTSDRKSIAHALGHRIDIRVDTCIVMCKEFPAAAISALYLVGDEHAAELLAKVANGLQERSRSLVDPAHALDALDDHGRDLVALRLEAFPKRRLVVERQEDDIVRLVHRRHDGGVVGSGYRQRCPAMKTLAEGHDLLATGVKTGQFE